MDAIVLAGGYATRLWPVTRHRPKMLLPVGDSTVLDRVFDQLETDDRIDDIHLSTNARFADDFESYLADSGYDKPTLSVEATTDDQEKLGTVDALAQLVDREGIDDDTLVVGGDNLITFDLPAFLDFFEEKEAPSIAVHDVGSRERASAYGVVELDGDRVVGFQQKPDDPPTTLVSIDCYVGTAGTVEMLREFYRANDGASSGPDEPGRILQYLQEAVPTYAYTVETPWFDIGTPESYLDAVAWHLDGDAMVEEGATVEDSHLGGNVHVMAGAEVVDSALERTVVFPGATVRDATLEDSIVDEHARVEGVELSGSLAGSHSRILRE